MIQILGSAGGILAARMPRPAIGSRDCLVRTHYSLISTGTETANLKLSDADPGGIVPDGLYRLRRHALPIPADWLPVGPTERKIQDGQVWYHTGEEPYGYALDSSSVILAAGSHHAFTLRLRIGAGNVSCGVLKADGSAWLATRCFHVPQPEIVLRLDVDVPDGEPLAVRLMVCNHRPERPSSSEFSLISAEHSSWRPAGSVPEVSMGGSDDGVDTRPSGLGRLLPFLAKPRPTMAALAEDMVKYADLPVDETVDQGWALGYSASGEVIAVGSDVREVSVGDLVACAGAGRANHAEYISVPVLLVAKLPAGVDCRSGCSATVGAIALQGVRRALPTLGERILVVGLGLIGQLTVQLARAHGCRVLGYDPQPDRVLEARRRGLHEGADVEADLLDLVARHTDAHGVDAVIVTAASKSAAPLHLAMKACRRRGRVVISGDVDIHPERADFYRKEIDLCMATSYGPGRYDRAYEEEGRDYPISCARWTANRNLQSYLECIAAGSVTFSDLVAAELPVERAKVAYAELLRAERRPLAVLLRYPAADHAGSGDSRIPDPVVSIRGSQPGRVGPLQVALVGAGAFAQSMLAPKLLAQDGAFQLAHVVSRNAERGGNFARAFGIPRLSCEIASALTEPAIDVVVIATRHHEHAGQVAAALLAGKHVFVEKPLAISWEGLEDIVAAMRSTSSSERSPMLLVGFNRRFSPAARRLAEELAERRGPLMAVYRVNAGKIPSDHWIQGAQGGGRNIGEACHMYDFFRFLVGAPVDSVIASCIGERCGGVSGNDNFSATITYADGSLATLVYTASGPKAGIPKERVEVYCGGEGWILDDFTRLTRAGEPIPLWEGEADKGHAEEFRLLASAIRAGAPSPIPFNELIETSAVALRVEEQLS